MKHEIKNYGFSEDLIDIKPEDYVLGAQLPLTIFNPSGQWDDYLPRYEPQAERYETWGCTVWGMQNQLEIFTKKVFGYEPNYCEQFNYIRAGVEEGGANPQRAYESARNDGLIDQEPMPDTFEEFKNPAFITPERLKKGEDWRRTKYEFKHDYLADTDKKTIKSALMLSPIAVSVTAWMMDERGLYIDGGMKNTHWCVAYGYIEDEEGIKLKVFDSYDHSQKILHHDHRIAIAKRIWVRKRKEGEVSLVSWSG